MARFDGLSQVSVVVEYCPSLSPLSPHCVMLSRYNNLGALEMIHKRTELLYLLLPHHPGDVHFQCPLYEFNDLIKTTNETFGIDRG